ncbi:IQ calmodulin-binding motif family protein, putative [Ichthyophthirius multifiliis]|uniref:IQ calmodulin-binding motif family protein, putative n=1 Tax=Ichthyophthirius multifiliis TaxID=5932 RepID=G0QXF6_ICHMU|nr:IQ calmodulin-binding motif family protein, putative [Ichthyophthirius multifiliis]EGR30098.1 IQ calmodulin-binding motif family protein, putative [Ichthyophthirius multifiliis]|eukprot:XP_004031334.1 IQ calmodulin-binding motif family protein, putative [Ichthyophthirius multifiliis]
MLELLHFCESSKDQIDNLEDSILQISPILNSSLFIELEQRNSLLVDNQNKDDFVKQIERIHNKAIFEAFNEALDYQRVYGLRGKPFPWKTTSEKISQKDVQIQKIDGVLNKGLEKVTEWASYLCGIIFDKEDPLLSKGFNIDEDYLAQIKEDRLARMLASEVIENEERWILYDEEQTEVQVELSQMVFNQLVNEVYYELFIINQKK